MKTILPILLLCAALPAAAEYGPPVLETADEFFVSGRFAGSSPNDSAVVDRVSGGVRMVCAILGGQNVADNAFASGVANVTGVAVGRRTSGGVWPVQSLAITSPETNRVIFKDRFGNSQPYAWPDGIGPRDLACLPVPGGASGLDGLAVVTVMDAFMPSCRQLMKNNNGAFSAWNTQGAPMSPQHVVTTHCCIAIHRQSGDVPRHAEINHRLSKGVRFVVMDSQDDAFPELTSCSGVLPESSVCYGDFNPGHDRSVVVFHVPGSREIRVSVFGASLQLSVPVSHDLGRDLAWVHPAPGSGKPCLTSCDADGSTIRIWEFNSANIPAETQALAAPAGQSWKGLIPHPGGGFSAAAGLPGQPSSLSLKKFTHGPNGFAASSSINLKPLLAEELSGDVLLFSGQPFQDNFPSLRAKIRSGGWTSNPEIGIGTMYVTRETWQGAELGMANPASVYEGSIPQGVTHGLSNQISAASSFYSLDPPVGVVPDAILFEPPAGPQQEALSVQLLVNNAAAVIHYRIDSESSWRIYTGPIGPLHKTTTIRAYASHNNIRSPIATAVYDFPEDPLDVSSGGDGVPDFVKAHYGLNPADDSGDADKDGFPDLLEMLAGSDPNDENSVPDEAAVRNHSLRFHLEVEPLSHNGAAPKDPLTLLRCRHQPTSMLTQVRIHRPDGRLEAEGNALQPLMFPPVDNVLFSVSNLFVPDPPLFWVAHTPDRFHVSRQASADPTLHGRGLFRLLDYQATPLYPLPRPALSGTPAEMADQWVAAMRDHFSANSAVSAGGVTSYLETLDLLLAERLLGIILHARGLIPDPALTLTPARGDTTHGRHQLHEEWLSELSQATAVDDGFDWNALLAHVRAASAGGQARASLETVAREFHRIGYHAFEDMENPVGLAPFDALRGFLETGLVPDSYQPHSGLGAATMADATAYLNALLSSLPMREHTSSPLILSADDNFLRGSWLVLSSSGGNEYWLADADGTPFRTSSTFRILPGSRYRVGGHLADRPGGGRIIMVDFIEFLDAPPLPVIDLDNNLLVDSWEAFLYGRTGNRPFDDPDGDGYSTLQEMFEWTDPDHASSSPAVAAVDLRPGHLYLDRLAEWHFRLRWEWPTAYQHRVGFFVDGTEDFKSYQRIIPDVPGSPGGQYQTEVDAEAHPPRYFYRAGMKLK